MLKYFTIKLIQIIHLSLILYILLGPLFFKNQIINVISILIFILYRWISNDNTCTLTKIENYISGENEGFIHKIINPIYKINEHKLNKIIYFITFSYLFILINISFFYKFN